ncbi:MAG: cellulase family glycosylhydrolase [Blautia sp.]|nr:cellulase family glycosylhydrolase [Blautia sp.]
MRTNSRIPKGFIHADGTRLVDGEGKTFQIRGVNLGNWFVPECYMSVQSVGDFDTGVYTVERALRAMKANPKLTDSQIEELYRIYMDNYTTEEDFREIAEIGLNTVRLPFTWMDLTTDGLTLKPDAFHYLDWALDMCEKYGLYAVVDLHGAVGSQNQDFHSGDDAHFDLYGNPEHRRMTIELWKIIAERYRDRTIVAGYDLLNECRRAFGKFGGKINSDFYDELVRAVRSVDQNHLIFIEYFTFPIHGVGVRHYDWKNVAVEYHIYNLTPLSQKNCLRLIRLMHQVSGNTKVPVYVGEFNAWNKVKDWDVTIDYFNRIGWSWSSWAYKVNEYPYKHEFGKEHAGRDWGLYVLDIKPVDLSTADFEEIADLYRRTASINAKKTYIYDFYRRKLSGSR